MSSAIFDPSRFLRGLLMQYGLSKWSSEPHGDFQPPNCFGLIIVGCHLELCVVVITLN